MITEELLAAGDRLEKLAYKFRDHKQLDDAFTRLIDEDMANMYTLMACDEANIPDYIVVLFRDKFFHIVSRAMAFGYSVAKTNS